MASIEVADTDLENGNDRHDSLSAGSDVSDGEDDSSCDSEFHSAVHSVCSELLETVVDSDPTLPSGWVGGFPEETECRICHMGLESSKHEYGAPMVLGCSCKDDLSYVHKHCAETWFKIKGNKTCEICGSVARNFSTENQMGEAEAKDRRFWRGHRFLNFILTCMVSAFIISWFFHFNIPSQ